MKKFLKYQFCILLSYAVLGTSFVAFSQDKNRARVSAQYIKVMNYESFINISAKYKTESGFESASDVEFYVYKLISPDSSLLLGKTKTDGSGKAKFVLNNSDFNVTDASTEFSYTAKIENNDRFEDSETEITFAVANLTAEIQMIDSVNQINAVLADAGGSPLEGQFLEVRLQRMFAPLQIGEESYETDDQGSIMVPIHEPMPGIDGNLTFEVVLDESDSYGTIQATVTAPIGIPVVDQSTFDKRTMWSPPAKTPVYLLIFPNLIIAGVWVPLLFLIFNLYRIYKSKRNLL